MKTNRAESFAGMAFLCGFITGVVSFIAAVVGLLTLNLVGAGVCFGASALAFGLIANAALRD